CPAKAEAAFGKEDVMGADEEHSRKHNRHSLRLIPVDEYFGDLEFDDEREPDEMRQTSSKSYSHECRRCGATTRVVGRHPYCTECNWDSLKDVSYWSPVWAA